MDEKTTIYDVDRKFHDLPYMKLDIAERLRNLFVKENIKNCLELGFYHGKSSAFIASILNELGRGHLTTIDIKWAIDLKPNIHEVLKELNLSKFVTPFFEEKSHTWRMMRMLQQNPPHKFDFCYIDSGHTWDDTGFGFILVDKLLKPGGWILFDDLNYKFRNHKSIDGTIPDWIKRMSEEEKEEYQVKNVWDLLVKKHPGYHNFQEFGQFGLVQKKGNAKPTIIDKIKQKLFGL